MFVCPSVRPSHADILSKHFFTAILVFPYQTIWQYSDDDPPPLTGAWNARGIKKSWFSSNISLYFVNDTKQNHSYYGRWIGNRNQAFEWCQFEWPRVILTTYSITRSIERSLRDSRASCESIVNTGVWRTDGQTDMPVIAEFLCKNQSSPRINIIKPWPYALFIAFTINCKKILANALRSKGHYHKSVLRGGPSAHAWQM